MTVAQGRPLESSDDSHVHHLDMVLQLENQPFLHAEWTFEQNLDSCTLTKSINNVASIEPCGSKYSHYAAE